MISIDVTRETVSLQCSGCQFRPYTLPAQEKKRIKMKMPEIHCSLQYLVDKLPFIADNVSVEKFGNPNMGMYVDAISLYSIDEAQPKQSNVYLCRPEQLGQLNASYQSAVLLCINNGTSLEQVPEAFSVLVVHCSQSLEFVFNALQKAIGHD